MKKLIKILAVLAAVGVVLLLGAWITLKIMFPPQKLQALAQEYAQKSLHREVKFSGVSFNLIGITLQDFALSEKGTFANGTFVSADKATAKLALWPLLAKRVEISTVGLDGLQVNILKDKDGQFNFSDLLSAPGEAPAPTGSETAESGVGDFSLLADRIYAKNCDLYYKDLQSGMDASVTKINLQIDHFDLHKPFDAALSFTTAYQDRTGLQAAVPVSVKAQADLAGLDMAQAQATLKNLTLTYKGIKLVLWGGAKNFTAPIVDLQGKLSGVSSTALAEVLPGLPVFVLPDIGLLLSAEANLDASSARLKQARLSLGDSALSVQGNTAWGGPQPTYQLNADLKIDLGQVAQMTQMLAGYGLGGQVSGQFAATDKNNFQDVKGTLTLDNLTVAYDNLTLGELNGQIDVKSLADISCNQLTGKLNQEPFSSHFAYQDLGGNKLNLLFNLDLSKLTLDKFPAFAEQNASAKETAAAEAAADGPETYFNVRTHIKVGPIRVPYFMSQGFELQGNLTQASATMKKSNGQVSFTLKEGAVTDLDLFASESKVLKILMLPLTLINKVTSKLGVDLFPAKDPQDKGKIKFTLGEGEYNFTNGRMTIAKTHINSAVSDMQASGTLDFNTEKLDMRVLATVLTSQTPIVIKIGGTMNDPSGKLDVAATAGALVGGILNYKTPGKVVGAAGSATKSVVNKSVDVGKNAADVGADAVKGTVGVAVGAIKGIGGLFKSRDKGEEKQK